MNLIGGSKTSKKVACSKTVLVALCSTLIGAFTAPSLAAESTPAAQNKPVANAPAADPLFSQPYIDADEWRNTPVRHRYVHGGFKGTDTRFSFYLPSKVQYQGHFFQHATPVPDSENLAQLMPPGEYNKIGFSIASGAYFVETNGGGHLELGKAAGSQADPTISAYRANAAAAQFSRVVALKMYGGKRPFGYLYGGSGGAYRTVGGIENTHGVWDGAVPYVIGSTMAVPNVFTVRIRAMRILSDKFPQIVDAIEPGGSGDPYAGLDASETAVLREATRMGFPNQSWYDYKAMGIHGLAALYPVIKMIDSTYFTDFWAKQGYLGYDHPEQFSGARIQYKSTISATVTAAEAARLAINTDASNNQNRGGVDSAFHAFAGEAAKRVVALRLAGTPPTVQFLGGDVIVLSGAAKGKTLPLAHIVGDVVVLGVSDPDVAAKLAAGDEVQVDNSNFLALETYHWHQVPGTDFKVWDQFRGTDGKPLYPQRPLLVGPLIAKATSGQMDGHFEGKVIVLASLWDSEAFPWQADWYRSRVQSYYGDKINDHFRLWYTDHAHHGDEPELGDPTHIVSYQGALQQALRDLSAWVEKGIAPASSTNYKIIDGQVVVPFKAGDRKGIQPVVSLKVSGGLRADVAAGQTFTLTGVVELPPGAGKVVSAEWDLDGSGTFPVAGKIGKPHGNSVTVSLSHSYAKPGTYYPVLRVASQRQGDSKTPYARIQNLGRVRVVAK